MIHNACIQIHPQIPQECLTETDMPPTKPNTPGYSHIDLGTKLFPLSQIPSLSLHVVSPSSTLCCRVFPAPGLLYAGLGGPVWNVVRRRRGYWKGGVMLALKKKKKKKRRGAQLFLQSIHPPTDLSPTWPLGEEEGGADRPKQRMQSDGITDAHTAIELMRRSKHTK